MKARDVEAKSRGQLVAKLLAGAWRTSKPSLDLSADDLDEVTPLLYNSGVAALAWWRIRDTDLKTTASGEILHQGYRLQILQTAIGLEKIELAHRLLSEAGIDAILVKGLAAAVFYPERALRRLGDIDIVVRPADYEAARRVFAGPEARGCWVDLHRELTEVEDRPIHQLFARSQIFNLRETQVRVLSSEDHLALLAVHLLKHGAWWPMWLCDIGVMLEALPASFDWAVCFGSDERRAAWIASSVALAHELLDAHIDKLPLNDRVKRVPQWMTDSVLKQWGNLFHADHLPVQPRPLMKYSLRSPRKMLTATLERWPDPITATFNMGGPINDFPRFPYQLGAFAYGAGRYLIDNL